MKNYLKLLFLAFLLIKCSTSNIEQEDQNIEKPIAVDDLYSTNKNKNLLITSLLENDKKQDNTTISSFDKTTKQGGTVNNDNNTFTYIPATNYVGEDSFTYTICNDKSSNYCSTATVTIKVIDSTTDSGSGNGTENPTTDFKIPSNLADYYSNLNFSTNTTANKQNLKTVINQGKKTLNYSDRHSYLYRADADLQTPNDVVLMYSGERRYWKQYMGGSNSYSPQTFNTEHVFPQSLLSSSNARSDLHHLRSCDAGINSNRGHKSFTDGTGTYKLVGGKWFPGDQWKGDVARMVLYLNVMYGESINKVGTLELFLKWNIEDPVSDFEIQRNNEIQKAQKNRNPFIDNPYLATLIFGGNKAENKWK